MLFYFLQNEIVCCRADGESRRSAQPASDPDQLRNRRLVGIRRKAQEAKRNP